MSDEPSREASAPVIRPERSADAARIRAVNLSAFEGPEEADIVDRLRAAGVTQLSLVAEIGEELVGHILFSEVTVGEGEAAKGMGLAPMAVLPAYQRCGVGSALVRRGVEILRAQRCPFVVVLGHPSYYPRFGFVPATRHGLRSEYDGVPDEAFMVLELAPGGLDGVTGVVRYRPEFGPAG
ncbi:MAG: GNAT family N-acetyltransferase [Thermoanaerobaculia bacterium]